MKDSPIRIVLCFIVLIAAVLFLSNISAELWGERPEEIPSGRELVYLEGMTIAEFGEVNQIPNPVIREVFDLTSPQEMQKPILDTGMSRGEISIEVDRVLALESEGASKNWVKIIIKFGLWALFLTVLFFLLKSRKVTPRLRRIILLTGVLLFGVALGSDPSPMGTVKDAVVLFARSGVIFPPRLIAFLVMVVAGVFLANKFICSWGCQFGVLQDIIFRLNRGSRKGKGILRQVKVPFAITNSVRILFFLAMAAAAFLWTLDIVDPIDPFKVFKPAVLGIAGGVFIGVMLVASLFIYRPWCHFFCPFGLVGWLVEKISLYRIHVDYDSCIACGKCSEACPSTVMDAILRRKRIIPDCFSCGSCIGICPTGSISFRTGRRERPPAGKFEEKTPADGC